MNRTVKIVLGVLVAVVIAAGCFYGGVAFGQNRAQATATASGNAQGLRGAPGQAGMMPPGQASTDNGQITGLSGGMLFGQIQAIGDGELTIKDESGQQILVYVTDTTLIQKQAEVTVADLQEGETVVVSGSQGTDGSITARMLQVSSSQGFGQPGSLPPGGQPGTDTGGTNQ